VSQDTADTVCKVRSRLERSDVILELWFLLLYFTGRTAIWCWARFVSDS